MFDTICDFFLFSKIGSFIIRFLFLVYLIVCAYFFCLKRTKRRPVITVTLVLIFLVTTLVHLTYFMPYSLNLDKNEIREIKLSLETGSITIEEKYKIEQVVDHLNSMSIRNSIQRPKVMASMRFDLQRGFLLSYFDDDLMGHIIFTRYYDQKDFDSYKMYVLITNEDSDGYLVHIKDCEKKIEELLEIIK